MPKKIVLKLSKMNTQRKRKTSGKTVRRSIRCKYPGKTYIVSQLLEMINVIKLYHWKTHSYADHTATDDLYEKLSANVDKFVEVYLGKQGSRIKKWDSEMSIVQYHRKKDFRSKMFEYREFLTDMNNCFDSTKDSDLLSIRDDILADINQFLYLFTMY